ncbi:gustatory and odorant receptor 22-like [Frankliniella occidentalis]|nr:gustatory and odorant receptor 22-like [Frankliniella occidentalis]
MLVSASTQVIWMFVLSFQAYRMSDLAHGAVSAMHGPVTAALDRLSMDARDEHFHRAVLLFYMSVSSRPAHLSLSGFANIDRPLFTSIVSLTVTYLIILMQFRTDVSQQ